MRPSPPPRTRDRPARATLAVADRSSRRERAALTRQPLWRGLPGAAGPLTTTAHPSPQRSEPLTETEVTR